jgi:glycerophosphoryl diester phosphodiesterase
LVLWCAAPAGAVRVVTFEIVQEGDVVLEATTGDQGEDPDAVWDYLRFLCFRPPDRADAPPEAQPLEPLTLRGQLELRARYGGRIRVDRLRLVPCPDQERGVWKLHPADYLQTFRLRSMPRDDTADSVDRSAVATTDRPLVIAHRGASGYLPEHTREAASLAYGMGADVIEQDVVLTRDAVPIVLHDIYLDTVTNVADVFPGRARPDGRWYALDFSLQEIKSLRVNERVHWPSRLPVYPQRFPQRQGQFEVATLAEMIELIQGLNQSTSRDVGIYPELKQPAWHRQQGRDLTRAVLHVLDRYAYQSKRQHIFLQCFDAEELKRLRQRGCALALIQLIGDDEAAERMWTQAGLTEIARYADGVGPAIERVVAVDTQGQAVPSQLVAFAHQQGLVVHAYTLRRDELPKDFQSFERLMDACRQASVDGVFSDFPDLTR